MADEKKTTVEEEMEENENVNDQTNDDESGEEDDKSNDKKESKSEKTFTQDQVNKMMTKEKNQGRNAAYKELGIDPKDSKMVKMFKAFVESQKTDDQKAAEKESEEKAKLDEANQRAMVAEAKAEAMALGVKTQFVDDVVTLALAKMTEDSDLKTIIGEFKTKYAVWFGESEEDKEDKKKTGQKGTGSSVKTNEKEKKGEESKGLGARLAAQRKTGSKKSSYWGR